MADFSSYQPDARYKFTFGLWTVGNVGRDPFGGPVRDPLSAGATCDLLGRAGAYGVNFHDNDLIPIDATASEAEAIKREFRAGLERNNLVVPMATTNLFGDPAFKDGAFTSNNAKVRAYAVQKTMRSMDLGHEFGAKIYVFWGGREGAETDAVRDPTDAIKRMREAMNFLCEYSQSQGYGYRFAFEAKPNEPRGHLYFAVTGSYLGFIPSLDQPHLFGVNPEVAHEHMAGLNFVHQVAAAMEAGKLFHIDLNDQEFGRYDQDYRFGSANPKHAFFLVKLLEDHGYAGCRHFDSHAYRQSDYADVLQFARGSMRTYELLAEKVKRWHADGEIQGLLRTINVADEGLSGLTRRFTPDGAKRLLAAPLDRAELAGARLPYEQLDQLTMEILWGTR